MKDMDKFQKIAFQNFQNTSVNLSFDISYSIILVEHYGDLFINFERHTLNGQHLIFLCPEEVLEIKNYVSLSLVSFSVGTDIVKDHNFTYSFGNIKKYFQVKASQKAEIQLLFNEFEIAHSSSDFRHITESLNNILDYSFPFFKEMSIQDLMLAFRFNGLVHLYYKTHHRIEFYADKLAISSKYLSEKFHALGIISPHSMLKKRILTEIKRQLLYTDKIIKVICFDVGFNDPAYFARFFKKNTGVTPAKFRKNAKDMLKKGKKSN